MCICSVSVLPVVPCVYIRPFQLTMLFHEYSDSNFSHFYLYYITINGVMLTIGKGSNRYSNCQTRTVMAANECWISVEVKEGRSERSENASTIAEAGRKLIEF